MRLGAGPSMQELNCVLFLIIIVQVFESQRNQRLGLAHVNIQQHASNQMLVTPPFKYYNAQSQSLAALSLIKIGCCIVA